MKLLTRRCGRQCWLQDRNEMHRTLEPACQLLTGPPYSWPPNLLHPSLLAFHTSNALPPALLLVQYQVKPCTDKFFSFEIFSFWSFAPYLEVINYVHQLLFLLPALWFAECLRITLCRLWACNYFKASSVLTIISFWLAKTWDSCTLGLRQVRYASTSGWSYGHSNKHCTNVGGKTRCAMVFWATWRENLKERPTYEW